jgi:hypothetical protein
MKTKPPRRTRRGHLPGNSLYLGPSDGSLSNALTLDWVGLWTAQKFVNAKYTSPRCLLT